MSISLTFEDFLPTAITVSKESNWVSDLTTHSKSNMSHVLNLSTPLYQPGLQRKIKTIGYVTKKIFHRFEQI